MKLHLDKDAFRVLIESIHEKTGYRADVLEKDYYVVLMLEELAAKQVEELPAYFKGGTALYKALKSTNRFSEDIDLSVDTRNCSRTQNDKRLEQATKKYTSLIRDPAAGRTNRSEIIAVYTYEPITSYDANDALQRFGKLKIEATSFTISEPVESLEISAMLYDLATDEQKQILATQYDVKPFSIQTISLERVFIDKLFAAEAYVRRSSDPHRAFEAAKHIYDLAVISDHKKITALLLNEDQMKRLLDIRITEERERLDGIPGVMPSEFTFFTAAENNQEVRKAYEVMQNQYVLRDCDRIGFEKALIALSGIERKLKSNPAWNNYRIE
ncbi:MAG: nucleotidyl transferase AbiEii/AbiGii toxin family protein [Ruminococcus sp.]|nr:nucleotidyl transferase AbiEii/AbiGii toxin family protein [Ruminococcus sp.]